MWMFQVWLSGKHHGETECEKKVRDCSWSWTTFVHFEQSLVIVRTLWLVYLPRCLWLYALLNSKFCLNWYLRALFEPRDVTSVSINMISSVICKDNRIAWAHRASAICNLWKICKCLLHQKEKVMKKKNYVITWLVMYLKKHCRKSRQTKFESVRAPFVTCTCATTLYSYYMRKRSFSANQKRVLFFNVLR